MDKTGIEEIDKETAAAWGLKKEFPDGKWSGDFVPEVGDTIKAKINNLGLCRVLGYFVEYGWVGVVAKPQIPPAWFVEQNGKDCLCGLFGIEIERA